MKPIELSELNGGTIASVDEPNKKLTIKHPNGKTYTLEGMTSGKFDDDGAILTLHPGYGWSIKQAA